MSKKNGCTHDLIMLITELLAHELAHPVLLRGAAVLGHQTGNYERHVVFACSREVAREEA